MSSFITEGTSFPNFYQFPEFLLRASISQTAKLAYMVLYDRARLSQKNGWVDSGRIYTVYPIKNMAATLGKSESTVKSVYNELDNAGLLIRKDGGFSKANILYVLVPGKGQFSDRMRETPSVSTDSSPDDGEVFIPATDSFPTPNKVIETNNDNPTNGVNQRLPYGRYRNVLLSEEEYRRLKEDLPDRADRLIEEMSTYCEANGKRYKNYDAALRSWAAKENRSKKPGIAYAGYIAQEGESL